MFQTTNQSKVEWFARFDTVCLEETCCFSMVIGFWMLDLWRYTKVRPSSYAMLAYNCNIYHMISRVCGRSYRSSYLVNRVKLNPNKDDWGAPQGIFGRNNLEVIMALISVTVHIAGISPVTELKQLWRGVTQEFFKSSSCGLHFGWRVDSP